MPGAFSQGSTREEALANIAEAMEGWLEATIDAGGAALEETTELIAGEVAFGKAAVHRLSASTRMIATVLAM